jgi:hypothetical protein
VVFNEIRAYRRAGSYRSVLYRSDGVKVELDGGGYNKVGGPAGRVPHDLAHFVVE